jgi:hypothetical protein
MNVSYILAKINYEYDDEGYNNETDILILSSLDRSLLEKEKEKRIIQEVKDRQWDFLIYPLVIKYKYDFQKTFGINIELKQDRFGDSKILNRIDFSNWSDEKILLFFRYFKLNTYKIIPLNLLENDKE